MPVGPQERGGAEDQRTSTGTRHIGAPREFNVALQDVVRGVDCSTTYDIASDLFGTLAAYNKLMATGINDLAGVADKPLAWLAGSLGLSALLNDETMGCCSAEVTTMAACVCRIASAVGLVDHRRNISYLVQVPPYQYVYTVLRAAMTNRTGNRDAIETLVPTWPNLLDVMEKTIPFTLGESAPRCSPTEEVRQALTSRDYPQLFHQYREVFDAFGASEANCKIKDRALFLRYGDELCSSPPVARLYFCSFLDASPLFQGTGLTSGGIREYVTIPNPYMNLLQSGPADADTLRLEIPQDARLTCAK